MGESVRGMMANDAIGGVGAMDVGDMENVESEIEVNELSLEEEEAWLAKVEDQSSETAFLMADDQTVCLHAASEYEDCPDLWTAYFEPEHLCGMESYVPARSRDYQGVFWTMNPIDPGLIILSPNGPEDGVALPTAEEIVNRRWLLININPTRPEQRCATAEEFARAVELADAVKQTLSERGWPLPVCCDSGNGIHLLYRINLPAEDGGLVDTVLRALAKTFDRPEATIDITAGKANQLVRYYGTLNVCRADTCTQGCPVSEILERPSPLTPVSVHQLVELAVSYVGEEDWHADSRAIEFPWRAYSRERVLEAAGKWLEKIPPAYVEDMGEYQSDRVSERLLHGFCLTPDEALPMIEKWNLSCVPVRTTSTLVHHIRCVDQRSGKRGVMLKRILTELSKKRSDVDAQSAGEKSAGIL